MSRPITSLRFPGESNWELWRSNRAGKWDCAPADAAEKVGMHGIQSICVDSSPFWSATQGDAVADHDEVSALRWEALGVSDADGARQSAQWTVVEQPHRQLIGSMAITADMLEHESLAQPSEYFDFSARMLPLPADGIAVWKELGRYVSAITRGGELLHVMTLSSPVLDAEAVTELRDVLVALDAHEFVDRLGTVRVWTECEPSFLSAMSQTFHASDVVQESRPVPVMPLRRVELVPLEVAQQRAAQQRRMRLIQIGTALAAIFVVVFASWALMLYQREMKLAEGESAIRKVAPQVLAVQEAKEAWLAMEPAVSPDIYPMEIYHQIVSLLPDRGIRLNEFQIDDVKLTVSGEASGVAEALDFREKLTTSEVLEKRFEWNFPVPKSVDGTRAQFSAVGTFKREVAGEGE